jgi:hypothetical protein
MRNIFQIYFDLKKKLPFKVRRVTWADWRVIEVVRIDPKEKPTGVFGEAYTNTAWYGESELYPKNEHGETFIGSSGSYQWIPVE